MVQKLRDRKVMMSSTVYLVRGDKTALIDSSYRFSAEGLIEKMRWLADYDAKNLAYILLTHSHPDHAGGTSVFKKHSPRAMVCCHPYGKDSVEMQGDLAVDMLINDGDRIDLGDGQILKVIHSPGHSQDSVCFLTSKEKALVTGDSLGPGPAGLGDAFESTQVVDENSFGGPYVEWIPFLGILTDANAYLESISKLKQIDFDMILPGHGVPLFGKMAKEHLERCLEHFNQIDDMIAKNPHNNVNILLREVCKEYSGFGIERLPEEPWNLSEFAKNTIAAYLRRQNRL